MLRGAEAERVEEEEETLSQEYRMLQRMLKRK